MKRIRKKERRVIHGGKTWTPCLLTETSYNQYKINIPNESGNQECFMICIGTYTIRINEKKIRTCRDNCERQQGDQELEGDTTCDRALWASLYFSNGGKFPSRANSLKGQSRDRMWLTTWQEGLLRETSSWKTEKRPESRAGEWRGVC